MYNKLHCKKIRGGGGQNGFDLETAYMWGYLGFLSGYITFSI